MSGADAATFLQGQFTNELRGLQPGAASYGLWLSLKGKVLADSFVVRGRGADEFWIGSYFSAAAAIRERLESFIIADDVTVEDLTTDWQAVSLWGAEAASLGATENVLVFPGRRTREPNLEVVFPRSAAGEWAKRFVGLIELPEAEMEARRIDAGIPRVPADVGPNDLPNEAGLEAVAISYTKGCYLGQEVMARLKSMGQVRRRLLRVRGVGDVPASMPAPIFVGERQVGELRSAAKAPVDAAPGVGEFVGLAMVSQLHVRGDSILALTPHGAPALRLLDAP